MTVVEAFVKEKAPDVRGPTAPLPSCAFGLGVASVALALGGSLAIQILAQLGGRDLTPECIAMNLRPELPGAASVCGIVETLTSPGQTAIVVLAILLGGAAIALGFSSFRRMDSRRKREQCVTGAVLGIQGVALSLAVLWFRGGRPDLFAKNFVNFAYLDGYGGAFLRAAKNTIVLAFGGELGGIVIGLILAVLVISRRPAVRAPARTYINFFRGTPLVWQLSAGYFFTAFALDANVNAFLLAIIVFSLNTGAYAAEVFRAGIQSIERSQIEAARSLGMSYPQAMQYTILPQAVRRVIPPLMNEFVILIKDTSLVLVLGLIASQYELFTLATTAQASTFNATFFTAAAGGYLVVTLPLIWVVNVVERRLRSGLVVATEAMH